MLQDCFPEKGTKFTTIGRRVAQVCISWMMVESGVTTKAFGAHTIAYVAEHIKVGNGVGGRRGQRSIRVLTLAMYLWLYVRCHGTECQNQAAYQLSQLSTYPGHMFGKLPDMHLWYTLEKTVGKSLTEFTNTDYVIVIM